MNVNTVRRFVCLVVAVSLLAGCSSDDKSPSPTSTISGSPRPVDARATAPPTDQGANKPSATQVRGRVLPELESMVLGLRVALGDPPPCQGTCNHVQGFVENLEGSRVLCLISYPQDGFIAEYGNEPAVGNIIKAFRTGCELLLSSIQNIGPPADSPAWRNAASAILAIIQPVAVSERARFSVRQSTSSTVSLIAGTAPRCARAPRTSLPAPASRPKASSGSTGTSCSRA